MHLDFSHVRIAVVGDLILDHYVEGSVARVSPEAPVAVLRQTAERHVLGGAANVAANLASLGAQVDVLGVVGRDEAGRRVTELVAGLSGVRRQGVVVDASRPTSCKSRVMSGRHQIVRIDTETTDAVAGDVESTLLSAVTEIMADVDVVVVSDYAKGVCSDRLIRAILTRAAQRGLPSIVDPKRRDFSIYGGATLIKPNTRELSDATGLPCDTDHRAEAAARAIIRQTDTSVLLTRSERGMSYFGRDGEVFHLSTAARGVFDISGAGDTVVALAALGYAAELPVAETMRLANVAAGLVVGKVGTAIVTIAELAAALKPDAQKAGVGKGALATLADAVRERKRWREAGLRVGFANGCFDLLHPGHVSLLRHAAQACDRLIVAINTDASVGRLKGPSRPIQGEVSRAYVLGALSMVDLVILFDEDTPAEAIAALQPDLLVKGGDYSEDQVAGADVVRGGGGRVLLVPLIEGQSTTSMLQRGVAPVRRDHTRRRVTADVDR